MPQNYIGSTSTKQVEEGYMGSIASEQYKSIWKKELKEHPELFNINIVSYHDTRPNATWKELQIQKIFNVVQNPLFVNKAYAIINGCFGMDVSGENNPNFQNHWNADQKKRAATTSKRLHKEGKLKSFPILYGSANSRYGVSKTTYKDINGNFVFTSTDDPRVLSKELVGVGTDSKKSNETKSLNPNIKKYDYIIIKTPENIIVKLLWNEYGNYLKEHKIANIISCISSKGYTLLEKKENINCLMKQPIKQSSKILNGVHQ